MVAAVRRITGNNFKSVVISAGELVLRNLNKNGPLVKLKKKNIIKAIVNFLSSVLKLFKGLVLNFHKVFANMRIL